MASYSVQHIYHNTNGLPDDDYVNTLSYAGGAGAANAADAATLAGAVAAAFYDATEAGGNFYEGYLSNQVSVTTRPTIKVYDQLNPGSPLAVATQAAVRPKVSASVLPQEVALCLSFRGNYGTRLEEAPDDSDPDFAPERPRSRVRGRIFCGPFNQSAVNFATGRPADALKNCMLNLAVRLAAAGDVVPLVLQWGIFSRQENTHFAAVEAWVDDAFDTQRRRGLAPTARFVQAITQ